MFYAGFWLFLKTAVDVVRYICTVTLAMVLASEGGGAMSRVFPFSERVNLSQPGSSSADLRGELVDDLRRQLGRWGATATTEAAAFSCGAQVDRILPGGGLQHGMLVE